MRSKAPESLSVAGKSILINLSFHQYSGGRSALTLAHCQAETHVAGILLKGNYWRAWRVACSLSTCSETFYPTFIICALAAILLGATHALLCE